MLKNGLPNKYYTLSAIIYLHDFGKLSGLQWWAQPHLSPAYLRKVYCETLATRPASHFLRPQKIWGRQSADARPDQAPLQQIIKAVNFKHMISLSSSCAFVMARTCVTTWQVDLAVQVASEQPKNFITGLSAGQGPAVPARAAPACLGLQLAGASKAAPLLDAAQMLGRQSPRGAGNSHALDKLAGLCRCRFCHGKMAAVSSCCKPNCCPLWLCCVCGLPRSPESCGQQACAGAPLQQFRAGRSFATSRLASGRTCSCCQLLLVVSWDTASANRFLPGRPGAQKDARCAGSATHLSCKCPPPPSRLRLGNLPALFGRAAVASCVIKMHLRRCFGQGLRMRVVTGRRDAGSPLRWAELLQLLIF